MDYLSLYIYIYNNLNYMKIMKTKSSILRNVYWCADRKMLNSFRNKKSTIRFYIEMRKKFV